MAIQTRIVRILIRVLMAVIFSSGITGGLMAQTEQIESGFKKLSTAEEQRLRAVLAEPLPQNALHETLRQRIREKDAAVLALSDDSQREILLREAVRLLPNDPVYKNNLARTLLNKGSLEEGNEWMRQAYATVTQPADKVLYRANMACDLVNQNKYDEARAAMTDFALEARAAVGKSKDTMSQVTLLRAASGADYCHSQLEQRLGRYAQSVRFAETSEQSARKALSYESSIQLPTTKVFVRREVANSLARKLQAYRAAGRLQDAEKALTEYMRYSSEVSLPESYMSGIYATAGNLRFSQREFVQSEALMRRSDQVLEKLGADPVSPNRASRSRDIFLALAAQKKWSEALREVERLDQLAGGDVALQRRVQFTFDRAFVYMGNQRFAQAAPLFESLATGNRKLYPESHFYVAQAQGLQGAALWRTGLPDNQSKALPLLKTAVRDYMMPINADFLENIGIRKEARDMVFSAYLEAMARTGGDEAIQAMGAADWVRNSGVQEALNDSAVRAAASTPALADVVRLEQDAKNEITGLRRYLAGEAGGAATPLPVIAEKMRARIAVLEAERSKLMLEIKAKFPDFDRLVHPAPPTAQDIARQLEPGQALLMLLPTSDAVYAWAVAADRSPAFVRIDLSEGRINALVARLRLQLDFGASANAGKRYDHAAAFELYDKLLAPLASVWRGKPQLLIAAGGALGQIPFAVLQTQASDGLNGSTPWLIREAAIAQVPSLASWLAIKSIAKGKPASQAFLGWGDPTFNTQMTSQVSGTVVNAPSQTRNVTVKRADVLVDLNASQIAVAAPSALNYADIPALPDTRDELLAIAAVLKADAARDVVLGRSATRESVLKASQSGLLARKRVVAFATHGLMTGDLPNLTQPALAMAGTDGDLQNPLAPLLTLDDVLTLKLNADWVVLSACNTAASDGRGDEALSGLARGFFYAGTRSMLVTHWSVESESAKRLTTATFEHYTANANAPKAESLRQAMLQVMAEPKYAHPAYWAPYALVGDSGR